MRAAVWRGALFGCDPANRTARSYFVSDNLKRWAPLPICGVTPCTS
ncbi:MAG TPA: hypothetical protein VF517_16660 [Thermoleophilaceae bacterium]|jgi:hypothetical protein